MRCRMSAKLVEVVRLNGTRAGCHDRFSSRRPVGGEVFYLDSPFIEPTIRQLNAFKAGALCLPVVKASLASGTSDQTHLRAVIAAAQRTNLSVCRIDVHGLADVDGK